MGWMRFLRWMTMVLTALFVVLWSLAQTPERPAPLMKLKAHYVGSQVCFECHLDVAKVWSSLPHSRWMLDEKLPTNLRGCEACHGPGSAHVIRRRGNILAWASLPAADQSAICLQCHQTVTADKWHKSPHGKGEGQRAEGMGQRVKERRFPSCTTCHEVHFPVEGRWMLNAPTDELCSQCHTDIAAKAKAGLHHPVSGRAPKCAACHDAHDGEIAGMLKAPPMQLCWRCHEPDEIKPADHTPEFLKTHGKKVGAQGSAPTTCASCHGRNGCETCHGVKMPHPKGFATKHTDVTFNQPQTCVRCHNRAFCEKCHADAPPISHDEANYAGKGHAVEFKKQSLAYCALCHQQNYCDDCHRQKGVPLQTAR